MSTPSLFFVFLGLSITSSWGNGHATTYRALVRALEQRGHRVLFLERDMPWYASHRDLPRPPYGRTELYRSLDELRDRFGGAVAHADLVVVGSFVPEGRAVSRWVRPKAESTTSTPVQRLSASNTSWRARRPVSRVKLSRSMMGWM